MKIYYYILLTNSLDCIYKSISPIPTVLLATSFALLCTSSSSSSRGSTESNTSVHQCSLIPGQCWLAGIIPLNSDCSASAGLPPLIAALLLALPGTRRHCRGGNSSSGRCLLSFCIQLSALAVSLAPRQTASARPPHRSTTVRWR